MPVLHYISAAGLPRLAFTVIVLPATAIGQFHLEETQGQLTVFDGVLPVFTYNAHPVAPPEGVDTAPHQAYLHPVYGLDGAVITEDFPADHRHHRGIFWGWPETRIGDRRVDTWLGAGVEQRFGRWLEREADSAHARVAVENFWLLAEDSEPILRETIQIHVHPAQKTYRALDFDLKFENIGPNPIEFLGAIGKGYGGFTIRPDARNKPFRFVSALGVHEEDALRAETPWADLSWTAQAGGTRAGIAVFQHPSNSDYPHPGWIMRHYGLFGPAWPHEETATFAPETSFTLRYRVLIHAGLEPAEIAEQFTHYESEAR